MTAAFQALNFDDLRPFPRVDAGCTAPLEQNLIKFGTANLEGVIRTVSERLSKIKRLVRFTRIADGKVCPELGNADLPDILKGAELVQKRQTHRKQRLTDVKPGVLVLFEKRDTETALSRKITQGGSGRPTPNNQDIGKFRVHSRGRESALDNFHVGLMMQALKNANVTPKVGIMQPQSEFEKEVAELIVEALNLEDIEASEIDPEESLFVEGLALDSIDALELALAITQKYEVHFKADDEEVQQVFGSLRTLSTYIAEHQS